MDRREWLKILAGGGAGLAVVGRPRYTSASATNAYYVVTDRPQELAERVVQSSRRPREQFRVTVRTVAPVGQDLTVIRGGFLVDPVADDCFSDGLAHLAAELRRAPTPATHMVSIEPHTNHPGLAVFECDGRVVDAIDPSASYDRIVIAGARGDTVFKLRDRTLSVVTSSCRHELCKAAGTISSGRIICAPNRLVASIGKPYAGGPGGVDAITG